MAEQVSPRSPRRAAARSSEPEPSPTDRATLAHASASAPAPAPASASAPARAFASASAPASHHARPRVRLSPGVRRASAAGRHWMTPSFLPTLVNAAIAASTCSFVCPADSCTRMRASPRGTTGNENPIT